MSPNSSRVTKEIHSKNGEEFYTDVKNRKKKLYELKQLMKAELEDIKKTENVLSRD